MVQHCYFAFSDHREAQFGSDQCQANYNEADIRFDGRVLQLVRLTEKCHWSVDEYPKTLQTHICHRTPSY